MGSLEEVVSRNIGCQHQQKTNRELYTVLIFTVFNVCNDTKMTEFLSLLTNYIQVFFIVFNVFEGMEIEMSNRERYDLKV
jgi:hypothetical protein